MGMSKQDLEFVVDNAKTSLRPIETKKADTTPANVSPPVAKSGTEPEVLTFVQLPGGKTALKKVK